MFTSSHEEEVSGFSLFYGIIFTIRFHFKALKKPTRDRDVRLAVREFYLSAVNSRKISRHGLWDTTWRSCFCPSKILASIAFSFKFYPRGWIILRVADTPFSSKVQITSFFLRNKQTDLDKNRSLDPRQGLLE